MCSGVVRCGCFLIDVDYFEFDFWLIASELGFWFGILCLIVWFYCWDYLFVVGCIMWEFWVVVDKMV